VLRWFGRLAVGLAAAIGAVTGAQLPEFAQQYRQRLGGALDEMRAVVSRFDADAARNDFTRDEALTRYREAEEPFLRDQGDSTVGAIVRYETLAEQRARLDAAPPLMRPMVLLRNPDTRVVRGAWEDYEPGLPTTAAGLVWAALGFFLLGGVVSLLRQLGGIVRGRRRRDDFAAGQVNLRR
jgi:Protein of unknown function (DUF2937)